MASSTTDPMYAIQDVPGKGKGLVATKLIPMGTRILCEEFALRFPSTVFSIKSPALQESIRNQVAALNEEQRQIFLSMHNIYPSDGAALPLGIIRINALPMGEDEAGIFLEACRINHACDNNAQKSWNENIKRHTVHAMRDIQQGQEITISYLDVVDKREIRQARLQHKFAFTCRCGLCSLPSPGSQESDSRLEEILNLDALIGAASSSMVVMSDPLRVLRYVDRQIQLYNEQDANDNGLPRAYFDAAQVLITHGDLARGRVLVRRAVQGSIILGGHDSPNVLLYSAFAQNPKSYQLYGTSMKWKTDVDDVPKGLEPDEFENWLWRRPQQQVSLVPGQMVNLRNTQLFPAWRDLANEYDPPTRKHWVFLGQIVDMVTLTRLQMDLEDVDQNRIPLFFYTDSRGSELSPADCQKGHTVAILYAVQHSFLFSEPGIRHEQPANLKIFRRSLHDLLNLSDQIQKYSASMNGARRCHGCDKDAKHLMKCAKCSLFWYCDGDCQKIGWLKRGHKADCKSLKDGDMKKMLSMNWGDFQGRVSFPLGVKKTGQ